MAEVNERARALAERVLALLDQGEQPALLAVLLQGLGQDQARAVGRAVAELRRTKS